MRFVNSVPGFNPQVVAPSVTPQAMVPTQTPREFFQHSLDNYTPMLALLFGLSTGNSRRDLRKIAGRDYQSHQSVYLAIAVAHDVLLRCSTGYPLHFQYVLHELLESQQVSNQFRDVLSAMRLSLGRIHQIREGATLASPGPWFKHQLN
mmetsp:Transcript_29382/g.65895  ORF Transcript_29382/g.65895 Transcript_29382/m.65895 type:complete len:149 (+) Transcript_29382:706-1152(+)